MAFSNDNERTEFINPLIYVQIISWGELVYFVEEQKDVLESSETTFPFVPMSC